MINIEQKRKELLSMQLCRGAQSSKLDAINKYLKKLRSSQPDIALAVTAADLNLQKFSDEIINTVKQWLTIQSNQPICSAALCHYMYQFEEFDSKFTKFVLSNLENGDSLKEAAQKLKILELSMELYYAGRKLPIGQFFNAFKIKIDSSYVAYYLLQGLIYFFSLYPLQAEDPKRNFRPDQLGLIKKKLQLFKDLSVSQFEKEKDEMMKNEKRYNYKRKKGFILAEQQQAQHALYLQLSEFKNCIENYCNTFGFPFDLKLEHPSSIVVEEAPKESKPLPMLSLYEIRDFEEMLPGILFQGNFDKDFEKEGIQRSQTEFIKRLSEKADFREVDDMFQEFMSKFTCNQRALTIISTVDVPQNMSLFSQQKIPLLARLIATFCYYWSDFIEIINKSVRQRILDNIEKEPSEYIGKLLMLSIELLHFDLVDKNKFMSIFKNVVEQPSHNIFKVFVQKAYNLLKDDEEVKERASYLMGKSHYAI